jgi:SAM-dependent methyltransferase
MTHLPETDATTVPSDPDALREQVRRRYAAAAKAAETMTAPGCACGCADPADPVSRDLYDSEQAAEVPALALTASLGCGNPIALAALAPGEVVLDLGSGGGIDVLLSARRVGPAGKAYGLDMTDEMLELARKNQRQAGVENVEFLKGHMEAIPLPDAAVDVVISNCVVNLSPDKDAVLRDAFRVLRPGGRLAISDIVLEGDLPAPVRRQIELWSGCIAGALERRDYQAKLAAAGFEDATIEVTRTFASADLGQEGPRLLAALGVRPEEVDGKVASAAVRARKPA